MTSPSYTPVAITLHWLFVLIFLVMFPLGYIMADMDLSPQKLALISWHKSIGVTALTLAVIRLAWRLFNRPPPLPADLPRWQVGLSHLVHWLIYAVVFAIPLTGWAMSSAAGVVVRPFGLFTLPNFVPKDKALMHTFHDVHMWLGFVLLALIAVHVGAALYHYFIRRDGVLTRMLPLARLP